MLVLTGVAIPKFSTAGPGGIAGYNPDDWRSVTVTILPDIKSPLNFAISRYHVPVPEVAYTLEFSLDEWAPFAAVSSFVNTSKDTTGVGFAVDVWRPTHFDPVVDVNQKPIPNRFSGVDVDVAVYGGAAAILYRISYHITLVGKIAFGWVDTSPE